jgi:tRNA(fMet)-specific endonuclease VapC
MNVLLDTNILVYIARTKQTDSVMDFIAPGEANLYVSVVSVAEIRSLALRNNWGIPRRKLIENFWDRVNVVEITQLYVNAYAQIDAYSQRLNPGVADYPFATPRNMGKNDLWIASLAALLGLQLVTTDADFDHLHNVFFSVRKINPVEFQRFF